MATTMTGRQRVLPPRLNPINWKIRNKIMALVTAVLLICVISLTAFSYLTMSQDTVTRTGDELSGYAQETINLSGEIVSGSVKSLQALALSPSLVEAVKSANQKYAGRKQAELSAEIAGLDQAWTKNDPSMDKLVASIADDEISHYLKSFQTNFPEQAEVFATDIQGLTLGMTNRTSDYLQADEGWWQSTYNGGNGSIYISPVAYDESSKSWSIDVGIPIRDETAQKVIGVLRGTVNVSVVFDSLTKATFGGSEHPVLLDRDGKILYAADSNLLMKQAPAQILALVKAGKDSWQNGTPDLEGSPSIVAVRFMQGDLGKSLGWVILLERHLDEVNAGIKSSLLSSLIAAAVAALVLIGAGLLFARSITQPLNVIVRGAEMLAMGDAQLADLDKEERARVKARGDEIGEIGNAFTKLIVYMQTMGEAARRVAAGDLTVTVTPNSDRDMLGNAFATMIANLRELVGQVADNANSVGAASQQLAAAADQAGSASQQIATTIQQVASGTAQQTEGVTKAAGSVDQLTRAIDGVARGAQEQAAAVAKSSDIATLINASIHQVASSAESGAQGASRAAQAARDSGKTISRTIEGMAAIQHKVGQSADKVKEMGKRSEQIGAIVETIDDIASQTNLIALNAAIEAARAGEHGKGFAVVADEVRKLAEKAAAATKEIGTLIKSIQASVAEAVQAMDEGAAEVKAGTARADQAGQAVESILKAVESVNEQVNQIAAAAREMSTSSSELVGAMESVSAVVEENTASTEEMAASSGEVSRAIEGVASVSEENSAAAEEVGATVEEMSAQVEEVAASADSLSQMAQALQAVVAQFKLSAEQAKEDADEELQPAKAPSRSRKPAAPHTQAALMQIAPAPVGAHGWNGHNGAGH